MTWPNAKYSSENVGELKFRPWLSKKSVPDYGESDMFGSTGVFDPKNCPKSPLLCKSQRLRPVTPQFSAANETKLKLP